ncbi:hypothetical protein [Aestuariivirga sp.]|uniref:hypothetical protein n=1 Tax=Aestuariivirga sp. TaxID=2650926 RepID=UPI0039E7193D
MEEVDQDEDNGPADADREVSARVGEVDNFECRPQHGDHAQPIDVGQPIGKREDQIRQMPKGIAKRHQVHQFHSSPEPCQIRNISKTLSRKDKRA